MEFCAGKRVGLFGIFIFPLAASTPAAPNPAKTPATGTGEAEVCCGFTGDVCGLAEASALQWAQRSALQLPSSQTDAPQSRLDEEEEEG